MAEPPLRVLIVDDETPARHRLRELLDDCAAVLPIAIVGEAQHGREALDILHTASADLVLTDIHMPGMDGIELARHLLKLSHPPVVIFTTAFHQHALAAFEVHAVDYLVKPVRKAVLLARIDAVMRRVRRNDGDTATTSGAVIAGPVTIDRERREVALDGKPQALTKTEFQILATLSARQGEAVSREELMLEVWGTAVIGRSRSLDFFIGQLRAKLAGLPLQTVRGFGFRLDH